jgi:hypothetical protein
MVALVGDPVALVGDPVALVGDPVALVSDAVVPTSSFRLLRGRAGAWLLRVRFVGQSDHRRSA